VYIYIELMWAVTSVKRERGEKTPLGLIPNWALNNNSQHKGQQYFYMPYIWHIYLSGPYLLCCAFYGLLSTSAWHIHRIASPLRFLRPQPLAIQLLFGWCSWGLFFALISLPGSYEFADRLGRSWSSMHSLLCLFVFPIEQG
jgi:hypothetical protein